MSNYEYVLSDAAKARRPRGGLTDQQIDQLITVFGSKLSMSSISVVRQRLRETHMSLAEVQLVMMQFKDPTISLVLSITLGYLGIDRFYIGDTGLGILKLITCGGFNVWWLIDWFLIMDATRDKNYKTFVQYIY